MIKQGSVAEIRRKELTTQDGFIVIAMCFYPRGLRRELRNEYCGDLAPDRVLFREWKEYEREFGHDEAFRRSDYENRFQVTHHAFLKLRELSFLAGKKDVYLICQCQVGERCHREMLMLMAEQILKASVDKIFHNYSDFYLRLKTGDLSQVFAEAAKGVPDSP
jgi:uncharacterized protein YeaO (DUF488 family)